MERQVFSLNIWYYLPIEIWNKMPVLYSQLEGWKGIGKGGSQGEKGFPYWFGFQSDKKYISASVEPSGLCFEGLMEAEEWKKWVEDIKIKATHLLGFKVGEIEADEVGYEIEWVNKNIWTPTELLNIEKTVGQRHAFANLPQK